MDETVAQRPVRPVAIARHPIVSMLLPIPVVCFLGVLVSDLAYLCSGGNLVWLDFSSWLLLAGLASGALAAIVLLIELIRSRAMRAGAGLAHVLLFYLALLVELVSIFVHSRDGWTAVAGLGLILSIVGVTLILVAAWLRRPALEPVR